MAMEVWGATGPVFNVEAARSAQAATGFAVGPAMPLAAAGALSSVALASGISMNHRGTVVGFPVPT